VGRAKAQQLAEAAQGMVGVDWSAQWLEGLASARALLPGRRNWQATRWLEQPGLIGCTTVLHRYSSILLRAACYVITPSRIMQHKKTTPVFAGVAVILVVSSAGIIRIRSCRRRHSARFAAQPTSQPGLTKLRLTYWVI